MYTISPTHALLLLLKKHQPTYARPSTSEREKYREISTMLFTGRTTENAVKFDAYMLEAESTGTPGYRIDRTPAFIHNDPVRRYFETYLAHMFLQRQLNKISSETIDAILDTYRSKLSQDIPTRHIADRDNEFGIAMRVAAKHIIYCKT